MTKRSPSSFGDLEHPDRPEITDKAREKRMIIQEMEVRKREMEGKRCLGRGSE